MRSIDEQIRQAMAEGKFDNLRGKGKPLKLADNPHADPEWRAAYAVLHGSGFTLPWIENRQEVLNSFATARQSLRRTWLWRIEALAQGRAPAEVAAEWQRAQTAFGLQIEALNKRIRSLNLEVPSEQFQLPGIRLERELELAQAPADSQTDSQIK